MLYYGSKKKITWPRVEGRFAGERCGVLGFGSEWHGRSAF